MRAAIALVVVAACEAPPAVAPSESPHAPLFFHGAPIGDVSGPLDVYTTSDRRFVRLTARGTPITVHLDDERVIRASITAPLPRAFDLGQHLTAERFDLCFDQAAIPIALRNVETGARVDLPSAASAVVLHGRSFSIDRAALCFANGDVAAPFVLVTARWDAPDGTRVFIESAATSSEHARVWSDPPKPASTILAELLVEP